MSRFTPEFKKRTVTTEYPNFQNCFDNPTNSVWNVENERAFDMSGIYLVVENSGMIGEHDVANFGTQREAWAYIERTYTSAERDHYSPKCLYPDVCFEVNGNRTYEI